MKELYRLKTDLENAIKELELYLESPNKFESEDILKERIETYTLMLARVQQIILSTITKPEPI